jgi:hypothetical protein
MEGTEYGGIVGGMKSNSSNETRTQLGRTWHGVLNSKVIQPDPGVSHLVVSGDANDILRALIARLGLSALFSAPITSSGVTVKGYQFHRYVKAYDGIRAMLASCSAKLKMRWTTPSLVLYAEPIVDYTDQPVDGDEAILTVERYGSKVNHLICLGAGELAARDVIHLYVDQFGRIGDAQYYTGLAEVVDVYDFTGANSLEELRTNGVKQLDGSVKPLSVKQVAELLGHTTSEITELYYVKRDTTRLVGLTDSFNL